MSTSAITDVFDQVKLDLHPTVLGDSVPRYESEVWLNEEPIQWLATTIDAAVSDKLYRDPQPIELCKRVNKDGSETCLITSMAQAIVAAATVAIGARIVQVRHDPTTVDKKNFEYIALLSGVLGSYGVYHDANQAYDIVPVLGSKLRQDLNMLGCFDKAGRFIVPDWYGDVMFLCRRFHIFTGFGLPKDTTINSPDIFKITAEQGKVIGREGIGVREVIINCLVSSSKLTELFGSYRILYTGLSTVRTTIELIGLKALHDLE